MAPSSVPPILLQPRAFDVTDYWVSEIGERLHHCRLKDPNNTDFIVVTSVCRDNATFCVSAVERSVIVAACAALSQQTVRCMEVHVVIVAFPNQVSLMDAAGQSLVGRPAPSPPTKRRAYVFRPLVWPSSATDVLRARYHVASDYEAVDKCVAERDRLRASLEAQLLENEELQSSVARWKLKHADAVKASRRIDARAHEATLQKERAVAAARTVAAHARQSVLALKDQVKALRADCAQNMDLFTKSLHSVEPEQLVQLTQVAVQCAHYFRHDRFTSAYFQKHTVRVAKGDEVREGLPLHVLASFPRIQHMVGDDMLLLRAACALCGCSTDHAVVWFAHSTRDR